MHNHSVHYNCTQLDALIIYQVLKSLKLLLSFFFFEGAGSGFAGLFSERYLPTPPPVPPSSSFMLSSCLIGCDRVCFSPRLIPNLITYKKDNERYANAPCCSILFFSCFDACSTLFFGIIASFLLQSLGQLVFVFFKWI